MKKIKPALLAFMILGSSSSFAQYPDFAQNPVPDREMFEGTPAPVDILSYKDAEEYRVQLTAGATKGPNFAGHYTIVTTECGPLCQENWVVDAQTGKIKDKIHSELYARYQPDSNLIIVNPPDPDIKVGYEKDPGAAQWREIKTSYILWSDDKFNLIHQDNWTNVIKILR